MVYRPVGIDDNGLLPPRALLGINGYFNAKPIARTSFTSRPNGSYTAHDTGQAVGNTGASPNTIASGYLTHSNTGAGSAGYSESNIGQRVGRVGATFRIPDATKSGTLTFVISQASWLDGFDPAGCHFFITATAWAYQVYDGSALTTILQGSHSLSSNVDYNIDITFEGNLAQIVLPDGKIVTVTDTRIGQYIANYGLIELYEIDATTIPLKVSSFRLDGVQEAPLAAATTYRLLAAAAAPSVFSQNHGTYDTVVSGTVELVAAADRLSMSVPSSGKFLAQLSGLLELEDLDNVYVYPQFSYDTGGNATGPNVSVARAVCFQRFVVESLLTGLTPGATGILTWFTAKTGTANATWHSGGANGVGNTTAIPVK